MEYSVGALAKLSGVSTRTLRFYDEIGLLKPERLSAAGYRIYGARQVDELQQILFYRALGVGLEEIGALLRTPGYDRERALQQHLSALLEKREQLDALIGNLTKTIRVMKGEGAMTDQEKFEGLKRELIDENERSYGSEVRAAYGDNTVDAANERLRHMTQEQYEQTQRLSGEIAAALQNAMAQGDPSGEAAQHCCALHKEWLCCYWPEGMYTKQAHLGLTRMYCEDERFRAHYEAIAPGATEFLCKAMEFYCDAER